MAEETPKENRNAIEDELTTAQAEYLELQNEVLDWYDVDATEQYVDIEEPSMRVHVLEAGSGDPVLLLHGGGMQTGMIWAPLMARLQTDFALYAPDRPGYGLSDRFDYHGTDVRQTAADFVCSTLDALDIDRANVVASSEGGYFAFAAALENPERFNKVVMAGYPLGIEPMSPLWKAPSMARPVLFAGGIPGFAKLFHFVVSRWDADGVRDAYLDYHTDVSTIPDTYFEALAKAVKLPGTVESLISFIKRWASLRGFKEQADLSADLPDLEVPTLILWGERDMLPPEVAREICDQLPNVTLEVAEGSGHFPYNDVPDWTADQVRRFFREEERE
jgi:pimeloyl-ACP methyl ester carboxylesterase